MSPRRDWRCKTCRYLVEDVPVDEVIHECPICKGPMEKVWSAPTHIFRGDGWTPTFHHKGDN